jgi:hypothetical protein
MEILKGNRYSIEGMPRQRSVAIVRSGCQTGVDRGALDAAIEMGVPIAGWVPRGGKAEDYPRPPGVLKDYPDLLETPNDDYFERTAWNVRDAHATLIIYPAGEPLSSGTEYTLEVAKFLKRPVLRTDGEDIPGILEWINGVGKSITLNVAGPRESKLPGAYDKARDVIAKLLGMDGAGV